MKTTKVKCPKCGAEFAIPEHEHVSVGVAIGKDSGLGTVYLPLAGDGGSKTDETPQKAKAEKKTKAVKRLEELKLSGVNTDNFFSIVNAEGVGIAMKWKDGIPVMVTDEDLDELEKRVFENGYVKNTRLYRRFVLAQLMRMMNSRDGFTKSLRRLGYKYQWKMTIEEIRVLSILEQNDIECFKERNRWFNASMVIEMLDEYIDHVSKHIETIRIRNCKGRPYISIDHRCIFVDEVKNKLIQPILNMIARIRKIPANSATHYRDLYKAICNFVPCRTLSNYLTPQSCAFIDAYKGEGAFYALKNLILFHGCKVYLDEGRVLEKYEAMAYVNHLADEYKGEGWRLFGFMKKVISDNRFDFKARMRKLGVKVY